MTPCSRTEVPEFANEVGLAKTSVSFFLGSEQGHICGRQKQHHEYLPTLNSDRESLSEQNRSTQCSSCGKNVSHGRHQLSCYYRMFYFWYGYFRDGTMADFSLVGLSAAVCGTEPIVLWFSVRLCY